MWITSYVQRGLLILMMAVLVAEILETTNLVRVRAQSRSELEQSIDSTRQDLESSKKEVYRLEATQAVEEEKVQELKDKLEAMKSFDTRISLIERDVGRITSTLGALAAGMGVLILKALFEIAGIRLSKQKDKL